MLIDLNESARMNDENEIDYQKVVLEIEAWLKLCAKEWSETGTPCRYSEGKAEAYQTAFYKVNDLRRNIFVE